MTAAQSSPRVAADPGLVASARAITERELASYSARTVASQAATERARKVLPLGVPSSFQAYDPHPIVVRHAAGARMVDVDGNEYIDYDMGFGALFAGHMNPAVAAAVRAQLDDGTLYVTPCELDAEVAELLRDRYGLPLWRFTNSGTEATMDAVRVARGATGRDKIVKVEGGYHGHHDELMISMKPPLEEAGPADAPISVPATAGIASGVVADTIVVPYNDPDALERVLARGDVALLHRRAGDGEHRNLPAPARLPRGGARPHHAPRHTAHLRRGEDRHHGRLRRGDRALRHRARPGHAGQVDRRRLPRRRVRRAAGVHGPHHRRHGAAPRDIQREPAGDGGGEGHAGRGVHAGSDRRPRSPATPGWSAACQEVIDRAEFPAHTVQFGAKGCVTWSLERVRNYRDYKATDFDLAFAQWIHGINRGVLLPPGLDEQWLISVMHTDDDATHYADVFAEFAAELTA